MENFSEKHEHRVLGAGFGPTCAWVLIQALDGRFALVRLDEPAATGVRALLFPDGIALPRSAFVGSANFANQPDFFHTMNGDVAAGVQLTLDSALYGWRLWVDSALEPRVRTAIERRRKQGRSLGPWSDDECSDAEWRSHEPGVGRAPS